MNLLEILNSKIKQWKREFGPEEFTPLGTAQYHWVNEEGAKVFTVSMTFLFGNKGTRNIKLDHAHSSWRKPKDHQYYHYAAIPWLNSTGWAATDDLDHLQQQINAICGYGEYHKAKKKKKAGEKVWTKDDNDNIIAVDFQKEKE